MTLLAANGGSAICRIRLTGEGRWVSLALSLGDLAPANQFLVGAERLLYEMAGVDEAARQYAFFNWQGGVISGARYAIRALKAPARQVCLHELRGQLRSGDVWAVSSAAALAVGRLLARAEVPLDLGGWRMEEEVRRPGAAEGAAGSANVVSSQPEPPQERAEDRPPASGKTGTNQATQDIPAAPGASADRPRD
jgi:hypothetical protein